MLKSLNRFTAIIILVCSSVLVFTQNIEDFNLMNSTSSEISPDFVNTKERFKSNLSNNGSEVQVLVTGLFYIYKEFFSSQDFNKCSFTPSCSVYGVECLKKHGMLKGGIITMDRLSRCHGFAHERYEKDFKKRLLIDAVPE